MEPEQKKEIFKKRGGTGHKYLWSGQKKTKEGPLFGRRMRQTDIRGRSGTGREKSGKEKVTDSRDGKSSRIKIGNRRFSEEGRESMNKKQKRKKAEKSKKREEKKRERKEEMEEGGWRRERESTEVSSLWSDFCGKGVRFRAMRGQRVEGKNRTRDGRDSATRREKKNIDKGAESWERCT